jgi:hypothetical protein
MRDCLSTCELAIDEQQRPFYTVRSGFSCDHSRLIANIDIKGCKHVPSVPWLGQVELATAEARRSRYHR